MRVKKRRMTRRKLYSVVSVIIMMKGENLEGDNANTVRAVKEVKTLGVCINVAIIMAKSHSPGNTEN